MYWSVHTVGQDRNSIKSVNMRERMCALVAAAFPRRECASYCVGTSADLHRSAN